jgi:glucokinase
MGGERESPAPGIAVDIGGSKVAVARADEPGEPIVRLPTEAELGPESLMDRIAGVALELAGPRPVGRVVVASAGSLDTTDGVLRFASNLPFRNYALAGELSRRLHAPVMLVGDTTAATVSEFSVPERRAYLNGVYVTVSTGIGMGMLLNGRLYTGNRGAAGELGHIPMNVHEPAACRCGQRGCLEAYASGAGLVDRARRRLADGAAGSGLAVAAAAGELSAKRIVEAAAAGDPLASGLVADAVELLSTALATILRMLGPEVIVLGGGLMLAGEVVASLRRQVAQLLALEPHALDEVLVGAAFKDRSALEGARAICRRDPRAVAMGVDASWTQ